MRAEEFVEFVEFARDGLALRGMLHLPDSDLPAPGVVLLHGFTGNRIGGGFALVKMSRALAGAGIASLRFDFAGSGESGGRFEDMSVLTELADARAAVDFLGRCEGVDAARLGVVGHSMGGCVAAMLLADASVGSGVLWAGVADTALFREAGPEDADGQLDSRGYIEHGTLRVGRRFRDDADAADPLGCVARSRADILVIHGAKDETVPPEHAAMFERAAAGRNGARCEVAILPEADHGFDTLAHEEELMRLVVGWFGSTLGGGAAGG